MPEQTRPTRKLVVNKLVEKTRGQGKFGEWILYKVEAENADGSPINEDLITFDELPLNEPITVEVEQKNDPKYGISFTLRIPRERLQDRVARLEEANKLTDERLTALEGGKQAPVEGSESASKAPEKEKTTPDTSGDDDSDPKLDEIPF